LSGKWRTIKNMYLSKKRIFSKKLSFKINTLQGCFLMFFSTM
jgi:hypothetical protein